MKTNSFCLFSAVFLVILILNSSLYGQGTSRIVASTNQNIPSGEITFLFFPVMNNDGQVAFKARILDGSEVEAFFRKSGNSFLELAREGDVLGGGGTIDSFNNSTRLNDLGTVVFVANLTGAGANDSVLLMHSGGALNEILREGDFVPFGGNFGNLPGPFQAPLLSKDNRAIIAPELNNTVNDRGIFRTQVGNVFTVAREGGSAPGGGTFVNPNRAVVDTTNRIGFVSQVAGGPTGLFFFNGNIVQSVVTVGMPSPDGNGSIANFLVNSQFGISKPNSFNQLAFLAGLSGTNGGSTDDTAVLVGDTNIVHVIAREGDSIPGGTNEAFVNFSTARLNDDGDVAFVATISNAPVGAESGLFINRMGITNLVVRGGEPIPRGNGEYGDLSSSDSRRIELNEAGVVLFQTDLVNTSNDYGIFLTDGIDQVLVAQKGQSLLGSSIVDLVASTSDAGPSGSSFNDRAEVAYRAILDDGRVVISKFVPELHWRGATSGVWPDSDSWTLGLAPDGENAVVIDPNANTVVTGPGASGDVEIASLQVGGGSGATTLDWPAGFVLDAGNDITIVDGAVLTGGGFIVTDEIDVQSGAEMIVDQSMFVDSQCVTVNGLLNVSASSLTIDGDLINEGDVIVGPNLGLALNVFGCGNQYGTINVANGSEAQFACLQGSGNGVGLGTVSVIDAFRPGGNQTTTSLSYSTLNFELADTTTTVIQIGGTTIGEYDRIVARNATIDGVLEVSMVDGFELQPGVSLSIIGVSFNANGQFNQLPEGASVGEFNGVELFITYEGGIFGNSVSLYTEILIGDVNRDGQVNLLDVEPFIDLLTSGQFQEEADVNLDGIVNLLDVQPFVELLSGA